MNNENSSEVELNVEDHLKTIGWIFVFLAFVNLILMKPIWGVCTGYYCDFGDYKLTSMSLAMGVGVFVSSLMTSLMLFGVSRIIVVLKEIRDK